MIVDSDDCPICMEPMKILLTNCTNCKKYVHIDCINKSLKNNDTCPFCRKDFD